MAESSPTEPSLEIPQWLQSLPLAPTYHPTLAELQDPISYVFKIEKEASLYGICKIVPPLSPASKATAITNFNRSLAAAQNLNSDSKTPPTFTTVQQQIGFSPQSKKKPVRQSGKTYTFKEFQGKAEKFAKTHLKGSGKKGVAALEIETLYWKACGDKPFSVEYAGDMPGSAFVPINEKKLREAGEATTVGETPWNMRGVSRAKGSLLRFMKEEIPGVTSPVVSLTMMFSWFGWHVEDHDLHSLNYLHMGAAKTWYGVPKEAAAAFEEVVRVHQCGGEVNPVVTCATLADKTTTMSPDVLIGEGVPCCRLVQNAGEFVVTFPRAYHSGFSHGFNCAEAADIATPEWLKIAKEAAVRRASISYPPMVSHIQLLYALALSLYSRVPLSINTEPRSSRLKEKKRGEGETVVKELFLQNVIQHNELLHVLLEQGSFCVLLPQNSSDTICSNINAGSKVKRNPRTSFGICSSGEETRSSKTLVSDDILPERNPQTRQLNRFRSIRQYYASVLEGNRPPFSAKYHKYCNADLCTSTTEKQDTTTEKESASQSGSLLDHGMFSCVTCGILCFACAAVIQPKETAAQYIVSGDCNFFKDGVIAPGVPDDEYTDVNWSANTFQLNPCSGRMDKSDHAEPQKDISSLDLLAAAYGNQSDSEDQGVEPEILASADENNTAYNQRDRSGSANEVFSSESNFILDNTLLRALKPGHCDEEAKSMFHSSSTVGGGNEVPAHVFRRPRTCSRNQQRAITNVKCRRKQNPKSSLQSEMVKEPKCSRIERLACGPADSSMNSTVLDAMPNCSPTSSGATTKCNNPDMSIKDTTSRIHIFCLEHAVEVEKQLRSIGGVHVLLVCHPDYPRVEMEAKVLAEELGIDYLWEDILYREATTDDQARCQSALNVEEVVPRNVDWAVKLGINLSYSASLSHDPLYSKQMPYNSILYKAFGCSSPTNTSVKAKVYGRRPGKRNKIGFAGKWCGKAWMSNQIHPYLAQRVCQKNETLISFHPRATPELKVKVESEPEDNDQTEQPLLPKQNSFGSKTTTVTKKSERKRKCTLEKWETKKPKYSQPDSPIEAVEDSPIHDSPRFGMILRSRQTKRQTSPLCSYRVKKKEEAASGPETRLRKIPSKLMEEVNIKPTSKMQTRKKIMKTALTCNKYMTIKDEEAEYQCDMDGCTMEFSSKQELVRHKRNICLVEGCGKKFLSHEYLGKHGRVHMDDRPLKCPWKGCTRTFKWAWARTEHIRVHTGVRPYECQEPGCGQTFRFVTDFGRHRRKTGHSVKKKGTG